MYLVAAQPHKFSSKATYSKFGIDESAWGRLRFVVVGVSILERRRHKDGDLD